MTCRTAHDLNRQAFELADALGDPAVLDEVDEQFGAHPRRRRPKVDDVLAEAQALPPRATLRRAFVVVHTATALLTVMQDPPPADAPGRSSGGLWLAVGHAVAQRGSRGSSPTASALPEPGRGHGAPGR